MSFAILFLLLFMINLAVALGAGIYETRIVLPLWFSRHSDGTYTADADTMRRTDTVRRFRGMVTTVPLTLLTPTPRILSPLMKRHALRVRGVSWINSISGPRSSPVVDTHLIVA